MPGDWIKIESDLRHHPKVLAMAKRLGVTSVTALGCTISVWGALDQFGRDGRLEKMGADALDAMVDTPGFASAMEAVGWLVVHSNGDLECPDYEAHNGPTAKARAATQKRVQKHRSTPSGNGNGAALHVKRSSVTQKENKICTPLPPKGGGIDGIISELKLPKALDSDRFRTRFREWVEIRLGMKRSKKPVPMFQTQLRDLAPLGEARAIACMDASIAGGWQGLFPERFAPGAVSSGPRGYQAPTGPAPRALTPEEIERREREQREAAHAQPLERWTPSASAVEPPPVEKSKNGAPENYESAEPTAATAGGAA